MRWFSVPSVYGVALRAGCSSSIPWVLCAACCEVPFGKAAQQPWELLFLNLPSLRKVLLVPLLASPKSCSKVLNSLITARGM